MMLTPALTHSRHSFSLITIYFLIGAATGIVILLFSNLSFQWMLFGYVVLVFAILALLFKHKVRFFQFLLIMSLSIGRPFLVGVPFDIHVGGAQNIPELFLSDIWLLILLGIWAVSSIRKPEHHNMHFQTIDYFALLYILWSLVSIVHAQNYNYGFFELLRLIRHFILYYYISRMIQSKKDIQWIIFSLMSVLAVQGVIAIYQYYGGQMPLGLFQEVKHEVETTGAFRVGGTLYGVSNLAQFLELLIPMALILALYMKHRAVKIMSLFIAVLGTTALIFTFSRGALLTLAFASILIICTPLYLGKKLDKSQIMMQSAGIVIVLATLGMLLKDEILLRFITDTGGTEHARIVMMQVALSIIEKNPLFGIGLNNYNEVMSFYDMFMLLAKPVYAVHNVYLFIVSETGVPGLITFVCIVGAIYKKACFIIKKQTGFYACITSGLMIGITSYLLIHCNLTMGFKYAMAIGNLLWLQFGLIVAIERILRRE
jgi:O-antigen ligase